MVLVEQRFQSQGIGTALLERAIGYLDSRKIPCMKLDATPQGRVLYEKLGFVSEYDIERWMPNAKQNAIVGPASCRSMGRAWRLRGVMFVL